MTNVSEGSVAKIKPIIAIKIAQYIISAPIKLRKIAIYEPLESKLHEKKSKILSKIETWHKKLESVDFSLTNNDFDWLDPREMRLLFLSALVLFLEGVSANISSSL